MISRKFTFERMEEILPYCEQYGEMRLCMYTNMDLTSDRRFKAEVRARFPLLDEMFYESCKRQCESMMNVDDATRKRDSDALADINKQMKTCTDTKTYNRLYRRRQKLEGKLSAGRDRYRRSFGTKSLDRERTRLHNKMNRKIPGSNNYQKLEARLRSVESKIKDHRSGNVYVVGKAASKGNRKFDFDMVGGVITFKPSNGVKIPIKIHVGRNQVEEFTKLQELIDNNMIAITVTLGMDYISLSYDLEEVYGYSFDTNELKRRLKQMPKEDKVGRTAVARELHADRRERMIVGKIGTRVAGVDLNPGHVGLSILDVKDSKCPKVIFRACYSIDEFINAHQGNSTDKIKNLWGKIWARIAFTCIHFGVAHFTHEDLEFKMTRLISGTTTANRKNNNLWCLNYQKNLITKHCSKIGMLRHEVNAAFSSYIGNKLHDDFDTVCASIEISRRGAILNNLINKDCLSSDWLQLDNVLARTCAVRRSGSGDNSPAEEVRRPAYTRSDFNRLYQLDKLQGYRRLKRPTDTFRVINIDIYQNCTHLYI